MVVAGSANTDMIIKVARIPKAGETILGGAFTSVPGGKGANQAVAAARAGGAVTFIARVGHDVFGDQAIAGYRKDGINVVHVLRDPDQPSGVALIFVGQGGQNSIAVASGANGRLSPSDIARARSEIHRARVMLLQLETPLKTVAAAVRLATSAGVRVILNPAPALPLPNSLLKRIDCLTPNESEAELLTGVPVRDEASAARAAGILLARGVRHVIVTLGERGALIAGRGMKELIPSHRVAAVDATGAGDVFNGALAVALGEGQPLLAAARFATAAAALSVTRFGAQNSAPMRNEIDALLATGKVGRALPAGNHAATAKPQRTARSGRLVRKSGS